MKVNMQKVNGYSFYQIGMVIHPLTELKGPMKLNVVMLDILAAKEWLRSLSNDYLVPLVVSKSAINILFWTLNKILPDGSDWSNIDFGVEMDPYSVSNIRQQAKDFETVFAAELNSISTYFVSQKLAYDTRALIESGEHVFPENVRKEIPQETINDIKQAGRCIAFDIPTAAAFHIIRATENVILQYLNKLTGKSVKPRMRNWGAYIKALRGCGADTRVTEFLDHIREHYRNPVLHPELMLDSQQVHVFLGVCVSAILLIIEVMKPLPTLPGLIPSPPQSL